MTTPEYSERYMIIALRSVRVFFCITEDTMCLYFNDTRITQPFTSN